MHDYESLWIYDQQRQSTGAGYWNRFMLFYAGPRNLGVDVDIRHPDADLSGYRLIDALALQLMNDERAEAFKTCTSVFLFRLRAPDKAGDICAINDVFKRK